MMIRSLRWTRVALCVEVRLVEEGLEWRRGRGESVVEVVVVEDTDCRLWELEGRWWEPTDDREGDDGKSGWVRMYCVLGSSYWIFRAGFSTVECVGHGRPGAPY